MSLLGSCRLLLWCSTLYCLFHQRFAFPRTLPRSRRDERKLRENIPVRLIFCAFNSLIDLVTDTVSAISKTGISSPPWSFWSSIKQRGQIWLPQPALTKARLLKTVLGTRRQLHCHRYMELVLTVRTEIELDIRDPDHPNMRTAQETAKTPLRDAVAPHEDSNELTTTTITIMAGG